jgi:hypothetical protein
MGGCATKPADYPSGPINTTTPGFTYPSGAPVGVVPGTAVETITTTTTGPGIIPPAPVLGPKSMVTPGLIGRPLSPMPFPPSIAGPAIYGGPTPFRGLPPFGGPIITGPTITGTPLPLPPLSAQGLTQPLPGGPAPFGTPPVFAGPTPNPIYKY